MPSSPVRIPTRARLFLALPIPATTADILHHALEQYPQYIERVVPTENWHVTLVFLGEVEHPQQYLSRLIKALPQTFVPTVSIPYVGRGLQRDQLWAYAHASTSLTNLRTQLLDRLRAMRFPTPGTTDPEYVPHIRLANLYAMSRGVGLADFPVTTSFTAREIHLYKSARTSEGAKYEIVGTIALTP